jgi:hypothetical protein
MQAEQYRQHQSILLANAGTQPGHNPGGQTQVHGNRVSMAGASAATRGNNNFVRLPGRYQLIQDGQQGRPAPVNDTLPAYWDAPGF